MGEDNGERNVTYKWLIGVLGALLVTAFSFGIGQELGQTRRNTDDIATLKDSMARMEERYLKNEERKTYLVDAINSRLTKLETGQDEILKVIRQGGTDGKR